MSDPVIDPPPDDEAPHDEAPDPELWVPVERDGFGRPVREVLAEDLEAAAHWDARGWSPGAPV